MIRGMLQRSDLEALDAVDPLAGLVARFHRLEGVVYLDGNSLGPLPAHVPAAVQRAVVEEWGGDLITSWNRNGWWTLARRVGDKVAPLIGVPPGSVIAGDTTSVALFKAATAARRLRPDRSTIVTDSGNFPTDLYVLSAVAHQSGAQLVVAAPDDVLSRVDADTAVVCLTEVDYRTARRHDVASTTAAAHRAGATMVWDLCHSAGALNVDVFAADFAVGCGYKYLNGGPGAPAFTYVRPELVDRVANPVTGWWGHDRPFAMETEFTPADGIERLQTGTQPIISLVALDAALDVFSGTDPAHLEAKAHRLTSDFIRLVDERLPGFEVVTPRDPIERGSHVSLAHPEAAAIMACLVADGVIGDVRPPDLLRFGFAPAYSRHVDLWDAVAAVAAVMAEGRWRHPPGPDGPVT